MPQQTPRDRRSTPRRKRPVSEFVWDGKYDPSGNRREVGKDVATRFDHVETIPGSNDRKGANRLALGDNKAVMTALPGEGSGRIDLIYADPPFDIGTDFRVRITLGHGDRRTELPTLAYRDVWGTGADSYAQMMYERLVIMHDLLSEKGSLYVHCDYRTTGLLRNMLDEIFGPENHVNEIIWFYKTGGLPDKLGFGRKHDTIHYYVKSRRHAIWNPQKEKSYVKHKYGFSNIEILEDSTGRYTNVNCRDVFDIPALRGNQPERVNFPTQKPEALLERIIRASSNEDSLVADFFCGSGTTGVVAERLGRRWILADASRLAVHTTRKRLLGRRSSTGDTGPDMRAVEIFEALDSQTPAGVADARVLRRRPDGGVDIELTGFTPSLEGIPEREREDLEACAARSGLDFVDTWGVDFNPSNDGTFCGQWYSVRKAGVPLVTVSDRASGDPGGTGARALVGVVDVFGRRATFPVEIAV